MFGGAESLTEGKGSPFQSLRRTAVPSPEGDEDMYNGRPHDQSDFLWTMTEEPHRSRRKAIIKAHPEVRRSTPIVGSD